MGVCIVAFSFNFFVKISLLCAWPIENILIFYTIEGAFLAWVDTILLILGVPIGEHGVELGEICTLDGWQLIIFGFGDAG